MSTATSIAVRTTSVPSLRNANMLAASRRMVRRDKKSPPRSDSAPLIVTSAQAAHCRSDDESSDDNQAAAAQNTVVTTIANAEDLSRWCTYMAENGVVQHSQLWLDVKKYTIGGSSIAVIMGLNSFQSLRDMLGSKLGLVPFLSATAAQWGNMLEETIKCEMEHIHSCTVYGEDLYIPGHIYGTSYSPDGLAMVGGKLVLMEFKCPYSRIPGREPPKYYVPQVKMGLELIRPRPDYGLYAEAVYRRCSWEDLGPNGNFDTDLVNKPTKPVPPISYGFIGFYTTREIIDKTRDDIAAGRYEYPKSPKPKQYAKIITYDDDDFIVPDENTEADVANDPLRIPGFESEYGAFDPQNYDLGSSSPDLFRRIIHALDSGRLKAYYGTIMREKDPKRANRRINTALDKFNAEVEARDWVNYGVLPWKLLRIEQHDIQYEPGFLDPYVPRIAMIVDFVKSVSAEQASRDVPYTPSQLWSKIDSFLLHYNNQDVIEIEDDE